MPTSTKSVKRSGALWTWATMFEPSARRGETYTDRCSLFWRSVLFTPMKLAFIGGFVSYILADLISMGWRAPVLQAAAVLLVIGVAASAVGYFVLESTTGDKIFSAFGRMKDNSKLCKIYEITD